MNKKNQMVVFLAGLFLFFSGLSYWSFDNFLPQVKNAKSDEVDNESKNEEKKITGVLEFEGPKTEKCPINGQLFTKEEKEIWEKRRPLLVMIENHVDSRPQSGLQNADVVYEAIAEGGITRFIAVYYCNAVRGASKNYDVGPVRSARTYFLDIASEYSDYPLYAHVGGANCSAPKDPSTGRQSGPCTTQSKAQAIEQIASYGWNNKGSWSDLSQFSLSYKVCRREKERTGEIRAAEHTMYCSTEELWNVAEERGLTNMTAMSKNSWDKDFDEWSFDEDGIDSGTEAKSISFGFWGDDEYLVEWKYNQEANEYERYNADKKQIDFNTEETLTAKNILIQFSKESRSIDEHKHNLYEVIGSGKGVLLQNGKEIDINWSKKSRTARTIFKNSSGKEIGFVPGRTWVEILPLGTKVEYASE